MSVQLSADFQNTDIMIKSKKTYCQVNMYTYTAYLFIKYRYEI